MITMFRVTENRLEGRMQTEQCHEYRTEEEGSFTYNELTVPTVNATKMNVQQQHTFERHVLGRTNYNWRDRYILWSEDS